jgi:DME family drug/metabolite transporter
VFWSITGIVVRLLEQTDEWQATFYRSSTLAIFLVFYLLWKYPSTIFLVFGRAGFKGVIAGACVGLAMGCNIVAITHTSVANATLMMAAGPIIAALVGRVVLGERVSVVTWVSILLACIGIAVMVGGNPLEGGLYGDVIGLLGMVGFGCYVVVLRTGKNVDMTPAVFYAGVFSAAFAAGVVYYQGHSLDIPMVEAMMCSFLGVVQLGIGSILFAIASSVVPAVELTLIALGEPMLAPIWVWLFIGEVPATTTLIGGSVLLCSVLLHLFGNPVGDET